MPHIYIVRDLSPHIRALLIQVCQFLKCVDFLVAIRARQSVNCPYTYLVEFYKA